MEITPKIKGKFIALLTKNGNVSQSVKAIGVSRTGIYQQRENDEEFAVAWDEAIDHYVDALEAEADRRAKEGTLKPVFFKGEQCGEIREYSDLLLIFRLKALRPDKYKDRTQADVALSAVSIQTYSIADIKKVLAENRGLLEDKSEDKIDPQEHSGASIAKNVH